MNIDFNSLFTDIIFSHAEPPLQPSQDCFTSIAVSYCFKKLYLGRGSHSNSNGSGIRQVNRGRSRNNNMIGKNTEHRRQDVATKNNDISSVSKLK